MEILKFNHIRNHVHRPFLFYLTQQAIISLLFSDFFSLNCNIRQLVGLFSFLIRKLSLLKIVVLQTLESLIWQRLLKLGGFQSNYMRHLLVKRELSIVLFFSRGSPSVHACSANFRSRFCPFLVGFHKKYPKSQIFRSKL